MSHAMQTASSQCQGQGQGGLLPSAPTMQDLESLLADIADNPAFEKAQRQGTITERAYIMRASIACGSMAQGLALVELLQDSLFTLTLNGAYTPSGDFTPWNVLARQYV